MNKGGFNRTLTELWLGIIASDIAIFLIGIWFIPGQYKGACAIGFWFGFLMALAISYHISWTLNRFIDRPEKKAKAAIASQAILRYLVTAGFLYLILISGFANPLAAFAGIMGLKFSAYLQPLIHKITTRKYPDPEPPPGLPDEEEVIK